MGALAGIFFRGVRRGAAPAYTLDQRVAWAGAQPTAQSWAARLDGMLTLVAEDAGVITGFMSLRMSDGYLDFAFVEPEFRGTSVAAQIYAVLENRARAQGLSRLHTEASHMAKTFFERHGWTTQRSNEVTRNPVTIHNWIMDKNLAPLA